MSSKRTRMTFEEFCEEINTNPQFRDEYFDRPAALVAECLHIQLEADRAKELKDTVDELRKRVPFPALYVPGKSSTLIASTGPQAH